MNRVLKIIEVQPNGTLGYQANRTIVELTGRKQYQRSVQRHSNPVHRSTYNCNELCVSKRMGVDQGGLRETTAIRLVDKSLPQMEDYCKAECMSHRSRMRVNLEKYINIVN